MTAFSRTALTDFDFANPIYAGATVTAFTVDSFGNKTAFLASLFADLTSSTLLANPQVLDGNGQWQQAVYINNAVILTVTGVNGVPDHQTGVISANLAGTSAADAATSASASQASFGMASAIFERVRTLYNKIKAQGLPTTLVALNMLRVNAAATAYELRTIAQVRGDIGLPAAIGTNGYLKSNGGGTAYAEQSVAQVRADVGLPSAAGSTVAGTSLIATGSGGYVEAGPFSNFRNLVINGDMRIDQRNSGSAAALTVSAVYYADRWLAFTGGSTAGTLQRNNNPTTALTGFTNSLRVQRTAANTGTTIILWGQIIESFNAQPLAGQTVTLSFWARCGANFSSAGNALTAYVRTGTAFDEGNGGFTAGSWAGFAQQAQVFTLSTSWQRFSFTVAIPSNVLEAGVAFSFIPTGTAGANDWADVTGVQLEIGSVASSFERREFGDELRRCQRYYETGLTYLLQVAGAAGSMGQTVPYKVTKRVAPTMVGTPSGQTNATGGTVDNPGVDSFRAWIAASGIGQASAVITWTAAAEL